MLANCLGKGWVCELNIGALGEGGHSSSFVRADDNDNDDSMVIQIRRFASCLVGGARGLKGFQALYLSRSDAFHTTFFGCGHFLFRSPRKTERNNFTTK